MPIPSFSHWILNRLTYVQTFLIVCIIFFISLFPILYFWVKTHLQQIRNINGQILEIEEEFLLKDLYYEIEEHRFNFQYYLAGDHSYQSKVDQSKETVIKTLKAISQLNESNPGVSTRSKNLLQRIDPNNIMKKWQELTLNNPFSLTTNKSEVLHTTLIENLQIEFAYLTSQVSLEDINQQENFRLAEGFSLRFPFLQENVSILTLLKSASLLSLKIDRQEERIMILVDRIKFDLNYLNQALETMEARNPTSFNQSLAQQWEKYYVSVMEILKFVSLHPQQETPSQDLFNQFIDLSKKSEEIGSEIWTTSLKTLKDIFIYEKSLILKQLWTILILTLCLGSIAFILGLIVTRLANARLIQLTEATESFTNGNLSVRLPEKFNDEIGKQVHAFNRMAEKLEEMIRFLFELLKSTTELANGNLSARLSSQYNNPEFDQVAHSFNKMAGTFEEIIGQLQTMIKTLANSAEEISTASKEQQTLIYDQEEATNEMALAAADIYSSSKDFVLTIDEMSQLASETSNLTQDGKEALNHMESIMHQLIDASKHTASRISTLSEQAQNITGIITTITKFADQTNLLSLNASIEAEKAGEYGRGFAVIAREIRRLADQTAASTLDIEKITSEITHAVNSTVLGVNEFTQIISESVKEIRQVGEQQTKVIEQVQTFTSRFDQINQGMQVQSAGAEQINASIENLSKKAQQTTTAIQKLSKTIQELRNTSNALHSLTDFIHLSESPKIENKTPKINIDLK